MDDSSIKWTPPGNTMTLTWRLEPDNISVWGEVRGARHPASPPHHLPGPQVLPPVLHHHPLRGVLRQVFAVMGEAELSDLDGVGVAGALPLGWDGHTWGRKEAINTSDKKTRNKKGWKCYKIQDEINLNPVTVMIY